MLIHNFIEVATIHATTAIGGDGTHNKMQPNKQPMQHKLNVITNSYPMMLLANCAYICGCYVIRERMWLATLLHVDMESVHQTRLHVDMENVHQTRLHKHFPSTKMDTSSTPKVSSVGWFYIWLQKHFSLLPCS